VLKEEKELRKYVFGPEHPMNASIVRSMITALIRAVREDCAKVCHDLSGKKNMGASIENAGGYNEACKDTAAAIRGRR
jgi:hypothetical protein